MKKIIILSIILSVVLSSCSATKVAREQSNLLSGTWTLNDVSYVNQEGTFKSVLFNDAQDICFEGSNWFFRDNNNTGRYTLTSSSACQGGDRFIRWSVITNDYGTNELQFKMIDEKRKDISGGLGYRLTIKTLTENSMILESKVAVDGSPISVIYEFSKKV